jgi:RNA polymerase sigma-70 factor (ECF subfamily)
VTAQALLTYEQLPDLQLVSCIINRETPAVRLVTQRNNQRLFRVAWSILRNRSEAEDVVQQTYVRAFAAIGTFNGQSSLSTWLTRIAINEALARKRSSQRRVAALNANSVLVMDEYREKLMDIRARRDTPEAALMRKQLAQLLERAIAMLPEAFRTTFVLREIEGLSVHETAEVLQIPSVTVKTRYLRARKRLQQLLDPELKTALGDAFPFAGADCEALTAKVLQRLGFEDQI